MKLPLVVLCLFLCYVALPSSVSLTFLSLIGIFLLNISYVFDSQGTSRTMECGNNTGMFKSLLFMDNGFPEIVLAMLFSFQTQ